MRRTFPAATNILAFGIFFLGAFGRTVASASPPPYDPKIAVVYAAGGLGVGVVFLGFFVFCIVQMARLLSRLHAGVAPTRAQRAAGFLFPHSLLALAVMAAVGLRWPHAWVFQWLGILLLVALVHAGLSGDRDGCLRVCSRRRLSASCVLIGGFWALAIARGFPSDPRQHLVPVVGGAIVLAAWAALRAALLLRLHMARRKKRYEGTWGQGAGRFTLEVEGASIALRVPRRGAMPDLGQRCVVFAKPLESGTGPFRAGTTLLVTRVIAGTWDEFEGRHSSAAHVLWLYATAILWGLSVSAAGILLR